MDERVRAVDDEFEDFWRTFPRRVGKLAAKKAYAKVRRAGIPHDELMDGVRQYIATKPDYQDWCHPTTWLNQGRWMDEPSPQPQQIAARLSPQTTRLATALKNIREAS